MRAACCPHFNRSRSERFSRRQDSPGQSRMYTYGKVLQVKERMNDWGIADSFYRIYFGIFIF